MSKLDDILNNHPLPTWRPFAWLVMSLLALAGGWAYVANLEEVAIASGEVVPVGQVKVIQHLEGGIVQAIHVTEGDEVEAGDPLVQLTLAPSSINLKELQVRRDGLVLARARLTAESRQKRLVLPEAEVTRRPDLARSEAQAFEARARALASVITVLREKILQRELDIKELAAKRRAVETDLGLSKQRYAMSQDLLEGGLTSKMEHVQMQREVESLQGQLDTLDQAIPRARAALAEAQEREREERLRARREANDELRKVEISFARTRELLAEATAQKSRTEIVSPIKGVVKNMRYHTIGGVVRPGEPIMEIVPSQEMLVIEARLNPIDRGYVVEGQSATVKISSYDFVRYGGLDGQVVHIAPDSSADVNGEPYFRVIVETDKAYLGDTEGSLPITPGMQATVDIDTGTKSVMEYLIKPVLKLKHEAFRER